MRKFNAVRNAVLVVAASLFTAGGAMADTATVTATVDGAPSPTEIVNIKYSGSLGNETFSNYSGAGYAGQINWDDATGDASGSGGSLLSEMPASFSTAGKFSTYCIDITQDIQVNQPDVPFTGLTTDLADAPVLPAAADYNGMGIPDAQAIENLYFNEYNSVATDEQAAAFQIAIWQIIYGTHGDSVTSASNAFQISNYNNSPADFAAFAGLADVYAAAALTGPAEAFTDPIIALTSPSYQDQLVVGLPNPSGGPLVPTPSAVVSGAVLLGGLLVRRRWMRV